MIELGGLQVIPLLDGYFRLDGGAMCGVVPKTLWHRRAPADERNRVRLAVRPLLVRTPSATVLIDAGTFIAEAIEREYVIFFEHDPELVAGIIRQDAGRRFVEPVLG